MSKRDYAFGNNGEKEVWNYVNKYLNIAACPSSYKWAKFDMEDENNLIEIKTRRASINSFPNFWFNASKLSFNEGKNKHIWVCYNLTDGVYIFDFSKHQDNLILRKNLTTRRDRGKAETYDIYECPTNLFTLIKKK
tara:strand:- start:55 stop:462 length:408 start_codon:yes stop_codon:yes gene_type:complete